MIAPCAIPAALREHAAFAPYLLRVVQLDALLPEAVVGWARRAHQNLAEHPSQQGQVTVGRGCPPYDDATWGNDRLNPRADLRQQRPHPHPHPHPHPPAGEGAIPTFIPPTARAVSAIDFERRVVEQNELIVRPNSLHDLMNALVWLTFPKTKRAISEAHVSLGVNQNGKTRPRRRDVLTVFDESGMIVLSTRDDLREQNRTHRWRELFVTHRAAFRAEARPILFGHGAMEQLGTQLPLVHRGLTAKALWLPLAANTSLCELDHYLATRIVNGERLHEQEHTVPMPLLGLPGWFVENESPDCYNDESVFRPIRSRSA